MKFRPLHDRVLVQQDDAEEVTAGGIIIPDSAQGDREKSLSGKVIAVGAGALDSEGNRISMDVKKGDRILYGKWSGKDVNIDGKDLKIIKESEIEGILG